MKIIDLDLEKVFRNKYTEIFKSVYRDTYPIEYYFLVTRIRFQHFIIDLMTESPSKNKRIMKAYISVSSDYSLQEQALKSLPANCVPKVKIR